MPKTIKPEKPTKSQPKSAKGGDLSEAELDRVSGGKHPAKVTVPDLKIAVS